MSKQKKCFIFLKARRSLTTLLLFLFVSVLHAQTAKVSGTVYDESGQPLPGVSVLVVGTSKGVATDFDGNFTIEVSVGNELNFNFLGFITKKIKITKSTKMDVTLTADVASLDEVIVVGYGIQKSESVVGAIGQLAGKELNKRGTVTNLTDALSGTLPGVTVLSSTGIPGGAVDGNYENSQILIRGKSTWNNAGPLVLVDGVERSMNDVDPNDVKSISVLKDASATSIFGVKGGNGVILITTNRGIVGDAKFKVDANASFKQVSRIPKTLNSYIGTKAKNYAIVNGLSVNPVGWADYTSEEELEYFRTGQYPYAYANTDWANEMLEDFGLSYKLNMSVSGGTEFLKYYGSLGYVNDGDILKTTDVGQGYDPDFKYERFNFRTNLDFTITKTTKLGVNLGGYYGSQSRSGAPVFNFWYGVYSKPWTTPILRYEDGTFGQGIDYERFGENEFVELNFNGVNIDHRGEINTNIKLEQDLDVITKGLKITGELAYDNYFRTIGAGIGDDGTLMKWVDPAFYTSDDPNANIEDYTAYFYPGDYINSTNGFEFIDAPLDYQTERITDAAASSDYSRLMYRISLNYNRSFGKHDVSGLALFSRENVKRYSGVYNGWPQKREDWAGRVTYAFDNRYNIELNGAYNGSEKFGDGYKFEFFPSVGLGWVVSNEKFFEGAKKVMSKLKLRYSDGYVGNDNAQNIGQWPYFTSYEINSNRAVFGDGPLYNGPEIYSEGVIGNPDLHWETAHQQNFGIELGFFDDKLTSTLDFWKERREDILVTANLRNVPDFYGAPAPAANIGITESHGYEFQLNYRNNIRDFNYWGSLQFTLVEDEIIQKEDPELLPDYQKDAGFPIDQTRSYISSSIIQSWDEIYNGALGASSVDLLPGDYRLIDYNADGVIDLNDVIPYGYPGRPRNTYFVALGGDYKGISLSLNFYGQFNVTQNVNLGEFGFNSPAIYQDLLDDTWSPEYANSNPTFRALNYGRGVSNGHYYEKDGSMFRLKTAELAYNIPQKAIGKIGLTALRVFVNGNNLILWSDLPVDIEGQDYNYRNYPVTKLFNVGLSATF
ncbi:TonB-dependent receptor [Lutibacter sp. HS1-25]|uniref:SusC/RagA family TonB-linked outer membrane protein n=1 Tax=Lutibacter sp. HS1-25 TaxID=2485000 RepID=UPI001013A44A|nr:TonB-dependent receptor [Lutibacter sp. HS1-25]RXP62704.1 TonB-dependent receptor [Lutibacter sp. HS1-25]